MILPLPSTTPFGADVAADVVAVAAVEDDVEDAATMLRVKRFVVALKKKFDDISSHYFLYKWGNGHRAILKQGRIHGYLRMGRAVFEVIFFHLRRSSEAKDRKKIKKVV